MTPDPTPAGTEKGWLKRSSCTCSLVTWTTAGFTRSMTAGSPDKGALAPPCRTELAVAAAVADGTGDTLAPTGPSLLPPQAAANSPRARSSIETMERALVESPFVRKVSRSIRQHGAMPVRYRGRVRRH